MKKDKIVRNILEKSAQEYIEQVKNDQEKRLLTSKASRQKHYE